MWSCSFHHPSLYRTGAATEDLHWIAVAYDGNGTLSAVEASENSAGVPPGVYTKLPVEAPCSCRGGRSWWIHSDGYRLKFMDDGYKIEGAVPDFDARPASQPLGLLPGGSRRASGRSPAGSVDSGAESGRGSPRNSPRHGGGKRASGVSVLSGGSRRSVSTASPSVSASTSVSSGDPYVGGVMRNLSSTSVSSISSRESEEEAGESPAAARGEGSGGRGSAPPSPRSAPPSPVAARGSGGRGEAGSTGSTGSTVPPPANGVPRAPTPPVAPPMGAGSSQIGKSSKHQKLEETVATLRAATAACKKEALVGIYTRDAKLNDTAQGFQRAEEERVRQVHLSLQRFLNLEQQHLQERQKTLKQLGEVVALVQVEAEVQAAVSALKNPDHTHNYGKLGLYLGARDPSPRPPRLAPRLARLVSPLASRASSRPCLTSPHLAPRLTSPRLAPASPRLTVPSHLASPPSPARRQRPAASRLGLEP